MGVLNIKDLKPSMILASPVYNIQGVMILGKGIEITQKHLSMLKSWGPLEVDVEGTERDGLNPEFKEMDEDAVIAVDKDFEIRFADVPENEVMNEIKRIAKRQTIKKMLNGE